MVVAMTSEIAALANAMMDSYLGLNGFKGFQSTGGAGG
jgi:hypothetical protein